MHPRQKTHDPEYYAKKIAQIKADAAPTLAKIESNDFTWRDVAIIIEYLQQYSDVLDEMESNPPRITAPNPNIMEMI